MIKNKNILLIISSLFVLSITSCGTSQDDLKKSYDNGYQDGYLIGEDKGKTDGETIGYDKGYEEGFDNGKEVGYTDGYNDGYEDGLNDSGKEIFIRPGVNLNFHTTSQQGYIDDTNPSYIGKYASGAAGEEKSAPNSIRLDYSDLSFYESISLYTVVLSETNKFENKVEFASKNTYIDVYNLKLNTKYYWYVKGQGTSATFISPTFNFTTKNTTIRNLYVPGTTNWRDMGNYLLTNNKRIKQGLLYRSAAFGFYDGVTGEIKQETKNCILNELKIKTDIDLATTSSIAGLNKINARMEYEGITNLIDDAGNKESIKTVFNALGNINNYPAVFHCTRGRDRTGAVAFLLGAYLGMSENDLIRDYSFTNFSASNSCGPSVIKGYEDYLTSYDGANLKQRTTSYLLSIGVSEQTLTNVENILVG